MRRSNKSLSDSHPAEFRSRALAVRSYRQITEILAQREALAMTPARVRRLCLTAEMKIAMALLADSQFRERLRPSAAQGLHAMQLRQGNAYIWNDLDASRG